MGSSRNKIRAVCVAGPTGSGKSRLAKFLARIYDGEVVNIDSRQVYADFPIMTAQPDGEDKKECPHHLYGFLPTEKKFSVGMYIEKVRGVIESIWNAGKLPVLAGGTGMYVRALTTGIANIPPVPPDITENLQAFCKKNGVAPLYEMLLREDPVQAGRIHPRDRQRILRALEVVRGTGHSLSWWHALPCVEERFDILKLGIKIMLSELSPRLEDRIGEMLKKGAMDEIERAYARCPDSDAPGWSGIGCRELLSCVQGRTTLQESCELWRKNTRSYAKRQQTWFSKEPDMHWFPVEAEGAFIACIKVFLA